MGCAGGKEKPVVKSADSAPKQVQAKQFGPFKVVPMGDFSAGKTSLLVRGMTGQFPEDPAKDFEEKRTKDYTVPGGTCKLVFHDTVGQEQYSVVTASIYNESHCQLLIYDVNNEESWNAMPNHLKQGQEYSNNTRISAPLRVLIGTKNDLPSKVERSAVQEFANSHDMMFFEVSAKSGQGVPEMFQQIAEKLSQMEFK